MKALDNGVWEDVHPSASQTILGKWMPMAGSDVLPVAFVAFCASANCTKAGRCEQSTSVSSSPPVDQLPHKMQVTTQVLMIRKKLEIPTNKFFGMHFVRDSGMGP